MQKNQPPSFLLIGNCIVDQVWLLNVYPDKNSEQRASDRQQMPGGNASNSAQILMQLGDQVELVANFADDELAKWLQTALKQSGIGLQFSQQLPDSATPVSSIWLDQADGSRTIVHHRNLPELSLDQLLSVPLAKYDWLHLEGRNVETLRAFLQQLDYPTMQISLELEKPREGLQTLLAHVGHCVVSSDYCQALAMSAVELSEKLLQQYPQLHILCTRGEQGVVMNSLRTGVKHLAANPVTQVVDTIGAGDSFIAGYIHACAEGGDLQQAVNFAMQTASRKIANRGMSLHE